MSTKLFCYNKDGDSMRYTKKEQSNYKTDQLDEAINRLGLFEDMVESITTDQTEISERLEELRKNNQEKSYRFRELIGRKLVNNAFISLLEAKKII